MFALDVKSDNFLDLLEGGFAIEGGCCSRLDLQACRFGHKVLLHRQGLCLSLGSA